MPKKTKKEKLLAQLHRSKFAPVVMSQPRERNTQHLPLTHHITLSPTLQAGLDTTTTSESVAFYHLIKGDLTKTVMLTTLILVAEFLLSRLLPR